MVNLKGDLVRFSYVSISCSYIVITLCFASS